MMKKQAMKTNQRKKYLIWGGLLVVSLVLIYLVFQIPKRNSVTSNPSIQPSASASVTPLATPAASPTVSLTPIASPSQTVEEPVTLPSSASTFLQRFFLAYGNKNRTSLSGFFTPDPTPELLSVHSRLFTGLDTNGNPGGPTLFSSNSANQVTTSYVMTSSAKLGTGWQVKLKEQRSDINGGTVGSVNTVMDIVPKGADWQVDSYFHAAYSGKYDGFLSE